ncbi:NnrS family protein [Billgrantia sulfidoxydans]|uniref:NnrS family protein n=1 Tax=Billgrantia sulfidoxydans TaxID=2733484 RepID=A0ABX7W365_9GAMM|nr:NnrS family protein [Halomonas sulfidoxydans]QTP53399.1 NnrS family protein [Halomonas sulfidoxydans]
MPLLSALRYQCPSSLPIARLAFRPFFLLASLFSVLAMVVWFAFWHGDILLRPHGGLMWWHQHEMLFGFGAAVVAGFLLTAVQNWTGRRSISGAPLLGLVALWLAARLLLAYPSGLPAWLLASVDLAFLPLAALIMARLVLAAKLWRNLMFVPVLLLLATANLAMHVGVAQGKLELIREGAYLAVLLIAVLMVLLGGRVIPFFTSRKLGRPQPAPIPSLEKLTLGSLLAVVLLQLLTLGGVAVPEALHAAAMLVAAVAGVMRLARWEGHRTLHEPLLWGLHLSYAFVPVGLAMWAMALLGAFRVELAVHALAIGGIGSMMLAMMARVSLGHTGRTIRTLPGIGVGLGLMFAAALLRSPVLAAFPQITHWVYNLSILFWCIAYLIFLFHYTLPLLRARVDGQEG